MKNLVLLFLITFASLLIHGYAFSTGDQSFHLPFLYRALDPVAYSRDYLFTQPEDQFTIFYQLVAQIIRLAHLDIQWLYFIFYLIIRFVLTLAVFNLSRTILKSDAKSILATALLSLPLPVGGTATATFDIAFMPRFLTSPALILGLTQIIKANYFKSALISGFIFLIHPFSSLSLGLILLGVLIFYRQSLVKILIILLTAFVPASPLIFTRLSMFLSDSQGWLMDPQWHQILSDRMPYLFLSHWSAAEWLGLLLLLLPVIFSLRQPPIRAIFLTSFVFTLGYFIFSELIPITPLIQLQPLRLWAFLVFLAPILLVDLDFRLALVALILLILIRFPGSFPIEWPHQNNREWDQLQLWVKYNTPADSLLITPYTRVGFRVHSQRAIVAEIKDGSSGLYSFEFARNWQQRLNDLTGLDLKTEAEIINLQQKYSADYLITFTAVTYPHFTLLRQSPTFAVYQLP